MTINVTRGESDNALDALKSALQQYQRKNPSAQIDMYRQNSASIRIRVVDESFAELPRSARHRLIWEHLRKIPEDVRGEVSMLVLLTPKEQPSSFANMEFDDPVPSNL